MLGEVCDNQDAGVGVSGCWGKGVYFRTLGGKGVSSRMLGLAGGSVPLSIAIPVAPSGCSLLYLPNILGYI